MATKCKRCNKPSLRMGLCEKHLRTPYYVDPRKNSRSGRPRSGLQRQTQYPLKHCERWRSLRQNFLAENAFCVRCAKRSRALGGGLRVVAVHVDHIVPVGVDLSKAYDWHNLQSLCRSCHGHKSKHERKGLYFDYANGVCHQLLE